MKMPNIKKENNKLLCALIFVNYNLNVYSFTLYFQILFKSV